MGDGETRQSRSLARLLQKLSIPTAEENSNEDRSEDLDDDPETEHAPPASSSGHVRELVHGESTDTQSTEEQSSFSHTTASLEQGTSSSTELMEGRPSSTDSDAVKELNRMSERMLHEFKRLGKVKEANLKRLLYEIGGFSISTDGFQSNKAEIVRLCGEVVHVVRDGPLFAKETASRLKHLIGEETQFHHPQSCHSHVLEVLTAFETGKDSEIFIELPSAIFGRQRQISLTEASSVNQDVNTRCHMSLVKLVQEQLKHISGASGDRRNTALDTIDTVMSAVVSMAVAWIIGQSSSFSSMRAIKRHPSNPEGGAEGGPIRQAFSELRPEVRSKLKQQWHAFNSRLPQLLERVNTAEHNFDKCLAGLDELNGTSGEYLMSTLEAVMELMAGYHGMMVETFVVDAHCSFSISLIQLGIWCALDMPERTVDELIAEDIDPYLRISTYFLPSEESED